MLDVPPALLQATLRREGEAGARWLDALPALVERLLRRWGCEVDGEPWHGEVAIVVPVRRGALAPVLKVSFPHPGNRGEGPALRHFDGRGAVRVLEADDEAYALLLERAGPDTLASVPVVDEAIELAGQLARRLAVPAGADMPALAGTADGWEEQLDRQVGLRPHLLPVSVVDRAREAIRTVGTDAIPTMTHGDLHFGNVLRGQREPWLAIDPKGWRGTAAFEAFTVVAGRRDELRGTGDLGRAVDARVRRFATAAGVDHDWALACCHARAVSSYLDQDLSDGDWFDLAFLRSAVGIAG